MKLLRFPIALIAIVIIGVAIAAAGQLADIYLKNGLRLRGDVTDLGDRVALRNQAGVVEISKSDITEMIPVEVEVEVPQPTSNSATTAPDTPTTTRAAADTDTSDKGNGDAELPAPPYVSPKDILRLKLSELSLDGPPEEIRVRFIGSKQQRDLAREVLADLQKRGNVDPDWEKTLLSGDANEKLQVILKATQLDYMDRIEVAGDPAVFAVFRRRINPLIQRGCARGGCHGAVGAEVFRFPASAKDTDAATYTSFVILDRLRANGRSMIDRVDPSTAPILKYLVGTPAGEGGHPVVPGKKLNPPMKTSRDPQYRAVEEWLSSLRTPHPNYDLEYNFVPGRPAE